MDSNINDFIEIILDCRGLTIHDYPHMSAKICTHPDDYFALISRVYGCRDERSRTAEGAGSDRPSSFLADAEAKSRINR